MAQWRKVIVSGSNAVLNDITGSGHYTGSASSTGSFGRVEAATLSGDGAGITGLTSAAIDSIANFGDNNRLITAAGASAVNAEANFTFDGTDAVIAGGGKVAFRDNGGEYIYSVSDNVLGLAAGSEIDLTATTIDINGLADISGNLTVGGNLDVTGNVSGDLTINQDISGSLTSSILSGQISASTGFSGSGAGLQYVDTAVATSDSILFVDADLSVKKDSIADFVTALAGDGIRNASNQFAFDASDIAGTGLTDNSENLDVSAAQTSITSIINSSLAKIGTSATEEYITFGTSNEVNTFIGNSEILSVTAAGVDVTGAVTISGNLDVNGTLTTIDSANTTIKDKFMILASGSTSDTDGGIIVQNAAGAGYALGYDSGIDRWVLDADLAHNATDIGPDAYMGTIQVGTGHGDSVAVPTYGGATNGVGTIYIDTDDSEIWIYA